VDKKGERREGKMKGRKTGWQAGKEASRGQAGRKYGLKRKKLIRKAKRREEGRMVGKKRRCSSFWFSYAFFSMSCKLKGLLHLLNRMNK